MTLILKGIRESLNKSAAVHGEEMLALLQKLFSEMQRELAGAGSAVASAEAFSDCQRQERP